jgi:hypothetical protein
MPESGFMMLLCLIGFLTSVYFIGSSLDFLQSYSPYFPLVAIGAVVIACCAIAKINEWREDRAWRRGWAERRRTRGP